MHWIGPLICSGIAVMAATTAFGRTFYASPAGGGDGTSRDGPMRVAEFWDGAQPGDELVLLDGTYTGDGSMIVPPKGLHGAKGAPITIRALNDGRVTIDGEGQRTPVLLSGNDYFVIAGLNACRSKRSVISINRSNHCLVRRCCGWDAADGNTNIFAAHYGEHNTFEDCAGWGVARKTYSCSQGGNYTTFRRCWGSWEGCHRVGPKMAFTLFYNSHDILAENCIATWDGRLLQESYDVLGYDGKPFTNWSQTPGLIKHKENYAVDQPYGYFAMDRIDRGPTKGPRALGCIAYRLKGQRVVSVPGMFFIKCSNPGDGWIENCAALIEPGAEPVRSFRTINMDGRNLTSYGASESSHSAGAIENVLTLGRDDAPPSGLVGRDRPKNGAHIYYRYVDGKLTDEALWPWPMNERIKDLAGVDVTATIFRLCGAAG